MAEFTPRYQPGIFNETFDTVCKNRNFAVPNSTGSRAS